MLMVSTESMLNKLKASHDIKERIKILNDYNAHEIQGIDMILKEVPGDTSILKMNLYLLNSELFVESMDVYADAAYILDFKRRMDTVEDTQTKRAMHVGFVDLLEKKLLFFKRNNIVPMFTETEEVKNMYKCLINMFQNDKKALISSGRIYPNLYGYIENKEHAAILFSEAIADILTDTLDFQLINSTLLLFLETLSVYGWSSDDLNWLIFRETEFYVKKALFAMSDIIELVGIVSYIDTEEHNRIGITKEYFTQIKCIILEVINDSISTDTVKDDTTYISIDDLSYKIGTLRESFFVNEETAKIPCVLKELDDYAEILMGYNEIYDRSTFYKEDLVSANEELGSFLIYMSGNHSIHSGYKNIDAYVKYSKKVCDELFPEIANIITNTLTALCTKFDDAKVEICRIIRDSTGIEVIGFCESGYVKSDGSIVLPNASDTESRAIAARYKNADAILSVIINPNYSTFSTIVELGTIADLKGPTYDGNQIHDKLKTYIFCKRDNQKMMSELFSLIFGCELDDAARFDKIFGLRWKNALRSNEEIIPLYKYLPLDILHDVSKITISENNNVEENTNDIIIEDFDFSDYDFAGTMFEEEIPLDNMTPFQIIRKIMNGELNLLKTNLVKLHKVYTDIIRMLN